MQGSGCVNIGSQLHQTPGSAVLLRTTMLRMGRPPAGCQRDGDSERPAASMAALGDAVSEKTVGSSLTLLLHTSRALLEKAKLEAQGRRRYNEMQINLLNCYLIGIIHVV